MNRFDIINRIGDKYRVGNMETGADILWGMGNAGFRKMDRLQ